jgi:hypothetical protein
VMEAAFDDVRRAVVLRIDVQGVGVEVFSQPAHKTKVDETAYSFRTVTVFDPPVGRSYTRKSSICGCKAGVNYRRGIAWKREICSDFRVSAIYWPIFW